MMANLQLLIDFMAAILLPLALVFITHRLTKNKEAAEAPVRESDQLAKYIELLASKDKQKVQLALLSLSNLKEGKHLSTGLLENITALANDKDPVIAAKAAIIIGQTSAFRNLKEEERYLVSELLLPLKIHFDRTNRNFRHWIKAPIHEPIERLEEAIFESNSAIKDILVENWHLLPEDLVDDAIALLEHYQAWFTEYERVRPGGKRQSTPLHVFTAGTGHTFPKESEQKFIDRYHSIVGEKMVLPFGLR